MKDMCLILNYLLLYFQISAPFFSTLLCVLAQEFQLREKGTGAERISNDSIYFLAFCKIPLIATVPLQRPHFFFFFDCSLWSFFWFSSFGKWTSFPLMLRAKWALYFSQPSLEFIMLTTSLLMIYLINCTYIFQIGKYILSWQELKLNW